MKRVRPPVYDDVFSRNLLLLLGEELKQSLIAIAQLAELDGSRTLAPARQALATIDNILLYQKVHAGQLALKLEPVHVGSTMQAVAYTMGTLLKETNCQTELHIQHGLSPVDTDRRLLESALQSLWQGIATSFERPTTIVCRARRSRRGVHVSLECKELVVDNLAFEQANKRSTQPLSGVSGPSTDLLTAHGLFELLGARMKRTTSAEGLRIGVTLPASRQLQIV